MRILLTEASAAAVGEQVLATAEHAQLVEMRSDGTLRTQGDDVAWEDSGVEIAWLSYDLFREGAPLRPFFAFLLRSPTLRWVQLSNAGIDHPVFDQVLDRGVRMTTAHVTDIPISEYVMRAVLDHYQRPHLWMAAQAAKRWQRHEFREVCGTHWLVIGVGAIGSAVALRATAMGVHVTGVRRSPTGNEPVERMVGPAELMDALPQADVVVLAAPATDETTGLVDERFLAAMKPGALLVNIARGSLVDEDALVAALDRGDTLEAAVLDVAATEPLPEDSPLWTHPMVTITPHDAAAGTGRFGRAADLFCENLRRFRAELPLLHEVRRGG